MRSLRVLLLKVSQDILAMIGVRSGDRNQVLLMAYNSLIFLFGFTVFSNEEDGRPRGRNRRNSDSVVYVKPKENDVAVVLSALKQAEIIFQQEKIKSLENEIDRISKANEERLEKPIQDAQPPELMAELPLAGMEY